MRILIVSLNYKPELTGIGKYNGEMAEWLVKKGHDVHIVTAPPYYPNWRVWDNYSARWYKHESVNGVKIWRCPLWVPRNPSGLKRILHLASFALSSIPPMFSQIFWRPKIVFVVEPPIFCVPMSLIIARISNARSWLHIQDFEVDAAFQLGIVRSGRLRNLVLWVERWLMGRFNIVSTISDQMLIKLGQKGVLSTRQVSFPNWVDTAKIYPTISPSTFRELLGISATNVVCLYSGNMGEKQGLDIIIEAARSLLDHKNIVFIMCGQGAAYSHLRSLSAGVGNIHWLDLQPLEKLNDLLNVADVHLLPQKINAADLVMPSKLTGMLASGRPVLATVCEETQISLILKHVGVIVPPENVELFSNAILELAGDREKRKSLGEKARTYAVEHFDQDAVLSRFEIFLLN